ncbi:hypothetical protein B0H14DRAFT_3744841, partial [Mycena olivaceomarginata]
IHRCGSHSVSSAQLVALSSPYLIHWISCRVLRVSAQHKPSSPLSVCRYLSTCSAPIKTVTLFQCSSPPVRMITKGSIVVIRKDVHGSRVWWGGYGSKGYGYGVRDGSAKMILGGLFLLRIFPPRFKHVNCSLCFGFHRALGLRSHSMNAKLIKGGYRPVPLQGWGMEGYGSGNSSIALRASIRSDTLHRLGQESETPCDSYANGTVSVTAIGTDSEGGTTYVEVETAIHSFFVTDQVHSSSLARPQTVEVIPVTTRDAVETREFALVYGILSNINVLTWVS